VVNQGSYITHVVNQGSYITHVVNPGSYSTHVVNPGRYSTHVVNPGSYSTHVVNRGSYCHYARGPEQDNASSDSLSAGSRYVGVLSLTHATDTHVTKLYSELGEG